MSVCDGFEGCGRGRRWRQEPPGAADFGTYYPTADCISGWEEEEEEEEKEEEKEEVGVRLMESIRMPESTLRL